MRLEAACHSQSRFDDGTKRDVIFGCIEAPDIEEVQDMIDDYSKGTPIRLGRVLVCEPPNSLYPSNVHQSP